MRKPVQVRQQQGMALVMGLVILLVMTLISISAMRATLMQERMSGAFQGQQVAFQAAEAALHQGTRMLEEGDLPITGKGVFDKKDPDRYPPNWANEEIPPGATVGDPLIYDTEPLKKAARQPRFYVERLEHGCKKQSNASAQIKEAYRIVSLGYGTNQNNQVVLETYYCPY